MSGERKKVYFNIFIGYIGIFLILIAGLRYIILLNDSLGETLIWLGLICIGNYFRFVESKLISTKKGKRIINWSFNIALIILLIIGFYVISNK
jgi:hypothetical protein